MEKDDTGSMKMKRWLCLLLACLLLPLAGTGEGRTALSVAAPEGEVHPWEAILIRYTLPEAGTADLALTDENGDELMPVATGVYGYAGQNTLYWNGTREHQAAPDGEWVLRITSGELQAETRIVIGAPLPENTPVPEAEERRETEPPAETAEPPENLSAEPPEHLTEEVWAEEILEDPVTAESMAENFIPATPVEEAHAEAYEDPGLFTPALTSPWAGKDTTLNYWTLPMDIRDTESIWQVLTAPMTVVDIGKGEKAQLTIRSEPSADSDGVGVVTCNTQGVHVLERGEEWSLIECYSSSFHDSKILNWNVLVQGYVQTKYLEEVTPDQSMGMVVDKLTQRLYIYLDGALYSTLLVSTGLANARQPYNETRSGEFILTSRVGGFKSDNLVCAMAVRFNDGDLLHEVPYTLNRDGSKNYDNCERKLGIRSSHGCIRVQRKKTPEGVNMSWIWERMKKHSRVRLLIWEDWQGRQIETPSDDLTLYYYAKNGQYYHSQDSCYSTKGKSDFTPFTYGQLEEAPFSGLERCPYCTPPLRKAEIEAINLEHALGGDHDPILTEARKTCPRPLKK